MKLYPAREVRQVCPGVTLRMLDYWVDQKVITPTQVLITNRRQKLIYLFSFEDMVRIRLVKSLRDAGISLQKIRKAIKKLQNTRSKAWKASWMMTDGQTLYEPTDNPDVVESMARGEKGQLVLSIIAIASTKKDVRAKLDRCEPIKLSRYDGTPKSWREFQATA